MINPFTAVGAHRELMGFNLSNARQFYLSMGKPLAAKGLTSSKTHVPMALVDFALPNARRFNLAIGNPLTAKGLTQRQSCVRVLL